MTVIQELAQEIGVNERTLRRGLSDGLVRGRRPSPRSVALAPGEVAYLRAHWPLISALRAVLRTEPAVHLAVLIGSAARGTSREGADVDVLVRLAGADWRAADRLRERLAQAVGRPVDLVLLDAALQDPLLLDAALEEGRILVDRDAAWPALIASRSRVARSAATAAAELRRELHALLTELSSDA